MDVASLGETIRNRRLLLEMSVVEVAQKAGVSASYLYAIEAGTRGSSMRKLAQIARVLGLQSTDLWPDP